jgi:hypothetical protein
MILTILYGLMCFFIGLAFWAEWYDDRIKKEQYAKWYKEAQQRERTRMHQ